MKRLIPLLILLLLCTSIYAAVNTQTWTYRHIARDDSADSTYISGDTLYVNLIDLVYGLRAEFDSLTAITLTADTLKGVTTIGDSCATGWPFVIDDNCLVKLLFDADSQTVLSKAQIYAKIDTTSAKIPTATVADSAKTVDTSGVRLAGLLGDRIHDSLDANWATFIADGAGDISSVALGDGGTGDASSGAVTLNVVAGTSTGLAVNADSVYIAAGGIGKTQIATNGVGSGELDENSVGASEIDEGAVGNSELATDAVDSTKIANGSLGYGDFGSAGAKNAIGHVVVRDTAGVMIKDSIYAHSGYEWVRLILPSAKSHPLEDSMEVSLEQQDDTTGQRYLFRDSTTAIAVAAYSDTVVVSAWLPYGITQAESLIVIYKTAHATADSSKIDQVSLYVSSGGGGTAPTVQWADATDKSSTTRARIAYDLSSDGDFNGGEEVFLKFVNLVSGTNRTGGGWIKVYEAVLLCKR